METLLLQRYVAPLLSILGLIPGLTRTQISLVITYLVIFSLKQPPTPIILKFMGTVLTQLPRMRHLHMPLKT